MGEIRQLAMLFRLENVLWSSRVRPTPWIALCVVCARLAFPGRWLLLADMFGRSIAWLSTVFTDTVLFLYESYSEMLQWHPRLTYEKLQEFAVAIERVGGAQGVWGFIDGTFRPHQRLQGQDAQHLVFSGHKRAHRINYQAIVTPDGLISSLTGPWPGPVND